MVHQPSFHRRALLAGGAATLLPWSRASAQSSPPATSNAAGLAVLLE